MFVFWLEKLNSCSSMTTVKIKSLEHRHFWYITSIHTCKKYIYKYQRKIEVLVTFTSNVKIYQKRKPLNSSKIFVSLSQFLFTSFIYLACFIYETSFLLFQGNAGLKPKEGEVTSRPWQWPINLRVSYTWKFRPYSTPLSSIT